MEGRHTDTTPVECEDCGWRGTVSECVHTYTGVGCMEEDVEPVDECPRCGSENLIGIQGEGAEVLTPV